MLGWLTAAAKLIGLGDFIARWIHDEEVKNTGEQIHENKDLRAQAKGNIDAAAIADRDRTLSGAELDDSLRRDGGGR